jgi:membrane protein
MFRTFAIPLSWAELAKRTLKETNQDNCLGLAAQLSYYFLLALVPAIVCVAAFASFFPPNLINDTIQQLSGIAPPDVIDIVDEQLEKVGGGANGGIFTVGLLMALWSSSAALVGICDALNRAYDIEEGRPWWKVRLTAIALTLGLAIFVVLSFGLVVMGPTLADRIASQMGLGEVFARTWKVLQWPVVFALIATATGLIYYFAPDAEQDWEWITPGAVLGTVLWLIASLAFKLYLSMFANYNETYGSLGGVIVLMLWFYLSALSILVGAEMNAEIEHASPHGKDPGEKVPGEKKKIGAAAARAYEERQRSPRSKSPQPLSWPAAAFGKHRIKPRPTVAAYGILAMGLFRSLKKKTEGATVTDQPAPER